jgi:hypothetical protein
MRVDFLEGEEDLVNSEAFLDGEDCRRHVLWLETMKLSNARQSLTLTSADCESVVAKSCGFSTFYRFR